MKKTKLVFIHYELVCGGAEQALYDLVCLLDKEKFDISVFVQKPGGVWDQKFRDAGIDVVYDYSCRKPTWNPIKKLGNFRKKRLVQKALENQGAGLLDICCPGADIVIDYSAWCAPEIAFAKGAKTVKYVHGDPGTNPVYRDEAVNEKERLSRYDRIVCVSQAAVGAFHQLSGLAAEMHYNPLNSEAVRRKAEEKVEVPTDLPCICAVGRLSAEKGYERLILIHKSLLEQGVNHKLILVGDGPDREFLARLIRAAGVEATVTMAGYQSNPYPYMKGSRFLVSSSFTEGLPVIAMEALCLGVPLVAPIPSVGEMFGEEACGIITGNDMASLEAGIKKMLTDGDFYSQTKAAAQRRSAYFDSQRMVGEIQQMLLDVLKEDK